jgi:hypothetical protein
MTFSRPTTEKGRGRPKGSLSTKSRAIRNAVIDLTETYDVMTVRGIFYKLSTVAVVPKSESGYRAVQRQVLQMRRDGVLDWSFVADGTRWQRLSPMYDSIEDALQQTIRAYRHNLWRAQGVRVEVWLEKDTLADVIFKTTDAWRVPLMVSRGQTSDTYVYRAAQFAAEAAENNVQTYLFMLYDSDSYGRNAAAKVEEKVRAYSGVDVVAELLAVTDDQIARWDLPTRPDKREDRDVVELDAIPPDKLTFLVEYAITNLIDPHAWAIEKAYEESERALLMELAA